MILLAFWIFICVIIFLINLEAKGSEPAFYCEAVVKGVAEWEEEVGFNELVSAIKKYQSAIDETKASKQTVFISKRLCPTEIKVVNKVLGKKLS